MFNNIYKGKKVLVTGHTGFKGSWLCKWLEILGSDVLGFSLEPSTLPNHFDNANIKMESIIGDITDYSKLNNVINNFMPNIIFHLASQPSPFTFHNDSILTSACVVGRRALIPIHRCTSNTYVYVRSFHTEAATRVRCKADDAKNTKHPSSASNGREAEISEDVATKPKAAKSHQKIRQMDVVDEQFPNQCTVIANFSECTTIARKVNFEQWRQNAKNNN